MKIKGFTLIELVIILIIVGILLFYFIGKTKNNKSDIQCNGSGFAMRQYGMNGLGQAMMGCMSEDMYRKMKFKNCSNSCDQAIDDNRDLTLNNSSTDTVGCLKICMGE